MALLVAVEVCAVVMVAVLLAGDRLTGTDARAFVLLLVMAVTFAEVTERVDGLRRFLSREGAYVAGMSVWTFASVQVMPAPWAACLGGILYLHRWFQRRRDPRTKAYRLAFSAAALVLGQLAAAGSIALVARTLTSIPHGAAQAVGICAAVVAFQAVNQGIVGSMMKIVTRAPSWRTVLPNGEQRMLETVSLIIGVLAAEMIRSDPWLAPSVLAVIALVQRGALVADLQVAAATDGKTNLLNAEAWKQAAVASMHQAAGSARPVALMIVDLDHFKRVNDEFGHLAGDRALAAVGACLKRELRAGDPIGRFGGEEFVVLLSGIDRAGAEAIADRLREAIAVSASEGPMRVTASIGVAHSPAGTAVDELLQAADEALYVAKAAGRNRVSARSLGTLGTVAAFPTSTQAEARGTRDGDDRDGVDAADSVLGGEVA